MLSGCTITIAPLAPKKRIYKHRIVSHSPHYVSRTPTPAPIITPKHPLQLEPTGKPTPIRTISPVDLDL